MITKEDCWLILNGKCTMNDAVQIFEMKDIPASDYFSLGTWMAMKAYHTLVDMGEIDGTKIFNTRTKTYDENESACAGDIGKMSYKTLYFKNSKWVDIIDWYKP